MTRLQRFGIFVVLVAFCVLTGGGLWLQRGNRSQESESQAGGEREVNTKGGGEPLSTAGRKEKVSPGVHQLKNASVVLAPGEVLTLPSQDHEELEAAAVRRLESSGIYRFANAIPVQVMTGNSGSWSDGARGVRIWRLRVKSPGAESLNLAFERYHLPEGSQLKISSPSGPGKLTPESRTFTSEDNEEHGQLWTPLFEGDELVLELTTPTDLEGQIDLKLASVNHGFRSLEKSLQKIGDAASDGCHLDVACSAENFPGIGVMIDAYRDQIRSVGTYTLNGVETCSGALVNNTANDGRPFFLTADHCGITAENAASMVVYWNFESADCRTPGLNGNDEAAGGRLDQFNSGAIFRSAYAGSDFCLVELDDPVDPEADPFFAGWDRSGNETPNSAGIHHPAISEKRISLSFSGTTTTSWAETSSPGDGSHARVLWKHGATEGGSSGSPLFDQDGRIIGQLHGGASACYGFGYDWYGRISRSWEGGGSPANRLKDWLDPLGTDSVTLDGIDSLPLLTIDDATVIEGDNGTVEAVFVVRLNPPADVPVTVNYATAPDSALAPSDFTPLTDGLTFASGETEKQVIVAVVGDTESEADERFFVNLSAPSNAGIHRGRANGEISNDDYVVPVIDSPLSVTGFVGRSFSYQITAQNTPRSFSLGSGAPSGMTVNASTGTIDWVPDAPGPVAVDITATNPQGSDTETLQIQVNYGAADLSGNLPPVLDQGDLPVGSVFAACYYYKTFQETVEHGWNPADPANQFSPTFILNQSTAHGTSQSDTYIPLWFVLDRIAKVGCSTLSQTPYTPDDYYTWPGYAETLAALPFRAEDYHFLGSGTSPGLVDGVRSRLDGGDLCVVEIPLWRAKSNTPGTFEALTMPEFDQPAADETVFHAYHSITIVGYDDSKFGGRGGFKIVNSWGLDWGDQGYAWVSYECLTLHGGAAFAMTDRIGYTPTATARLAFDHRYFNYDKISVTLGVGDPDAPTWSMIAAYWGDILRSSHDVDIAVDLTEGVDYLPATEERKWWVSLDDNSRDDKITLSTFEISMGASTDSAASVLPIAASQLYASTAYAFIPTGDNSANQYYVNDSDTNGDVHTTAIGNDANDGLSPAAPKANVQAIVDTYALKGGDTVWIDSGTYTTPLIVNQLDRGEPGNRLRFAGATAPNGEPATIFDFTGDDSSWVFRFQEAASNLEFSDIEIKGGYRGISYDGQWTTNENLLLERVRISNENMLCYLDGVTGTVFDHCVFFHSAQSFQSGIILESSYLDVFNSTIAASAGRLAFQQYTGGNQSSPKLSLKDSIIYGAGSSGNLVSASNGTLSASYNLFGSDGGRPIGRTVDATNSMGDPRFADVANGDFHLQSVAGRWDPAANANAGGFVSDGVQSPGIDAGDLTNAAGSEPVENGGRLNVGAYGGTARASKSTAPSRFLVLNSPAAGSIAVDLITFDWNTYGNGWLPGDTLKLEYSDDGGSNWQTAAGAGAIPYLAGTYSWDASAIGAGTNFQIRLIANADPAVASVSPGVFALDHPTLYYVNDADTAGDVYTFAAGASANDGLSAATPKSSITEVLDTYDLEGGDIIYVDTGTYVLTATLGIGSDDGGDAYNPLKVIGSTTWGGTILDRSDANSDVVSLSGRTHLENLWVTGGDTGINVTAADCAIVSSRITGNDNWGVYFLGGAARSTVRNCIFDNNTSFGLQVYQADDCVFENNVIFNQRSGVWLRSAAENTLLRNNIIRGQSNGTAIAISDTSSLPISDYNCLQAITSSAIGSINSVYYYTLEEWQAASGQDVHSISIDPGFVDADGIDNIAGNADDDFHLESTGGSWHGGLFTADAGNSLCVNSGDPNYAFGSESLPNGNRINLGAYGGTEEASRTPTGRLIQLTAPNRASAVSSGIVSIVWTVQGQAWNGGDTVKLEYSPDGGSTWQSIAGAGSIPHDQGSFAWDTTATPNSPFAMVRIVSIQDGAVSDASDEAHLLRNSPMSYYVNDGSTTNDTHTTAIGLPGNDGVSPASPKDSIQDILDAYNLEPGDTIYVDSGHYILTSNLSIGSADQGDSSAPVTILGVPDWGGTKIDRNDISNASVYGVLLSSADYISLRDISITGGGVGVRISSSSNCEIRHCRIYGNAYYGIYATDSSSRYCDINGSLIDNNGNIGIITSNASFMSVVNSTIFGHSESAVSFGSLSGSHTIRNSILTAASNSSRALSVFASASLSASDYNNFHLIGDAVLRDSDNNDHTSLLSWQNATGFDLNSISTDPRFVDPDGADNIPGNEDDDFHLQSTVGSWHGGAFASDGNDSPSIDAGDPGDGIGTESTPDGGIINQGAFGGTSEASRSQSGRLLTLTSPNGNSVEAGHVSIAWRTTGAGWMPTDTVKLEYSPNGGGTWFPVAGAGSLPYNVGYFFWDAEAIASSPLLLVRATSNQNGAVSDASDSHVLLHNSPITYYVNDGLTAGDVHTTAPGNSANDGISPATPKAGLQEIFDAYDLEPGDIVYVDTGNFVLTSNVVIGANDSGDSSAPVRIIGSTATGGTVLDRNDPGSSQFPVYLVYANRVWLENLSVTGGYRGFYAYESDACLFRNCRSYGNVYADFSFSYGSGHVIENSLASGNGSRGISLYYADDCRITRSTITGHARQIDLSNSVERLSLSNTVIRSDGAGQYGIYAPGSDDIADSDYNLIYSTNGASIGYRGSAQPTLADWQTATGLDINSVSADPLFVDADGADNTSGNADDDFHLQSTAGSWHGGAFTSDTGDSPAIDAGNPADSIGSESAPDGNRINLGAYAGTLEASRSYATRGIALLSPQSGEIAKSSLLIEWLATGVDRLPSDTVSLSYSSDGGTTWTPIAGGAGLPASGGQFNWMFPSLDHGASYRIRVVSDQATGAVAESGDFTIDGVYYVNDGSLAGDIYTTAVGDDLNDGASPARPKATLKALIDDVDLEPGDLVLVDSGNYSLADNVVIGTEDGGSFSGGKVTFRGVKGSTIFDRGDSTTTTTRCIEVATSYVVVEGFHCRNAYYGISTSASRLEIVNNRADNCGDAAFLIGATVETTISGNLLIQSGGTTGALRLSASTSSDLRATFTNNTIVAYQTDGVDSSYIRSGPEFFGNIISVDGGMAFDMADAYDIADSDYNVFHLASVPRFAEAYTNLSPDLDHWRLLWGLDTHSLVADPRFVDPGNGDYHLMSAGGRYDPSTGLVPGNPAAWVSDTATSPAIDAGDPELPPDQESAQNGGRRNAGAYGGGAEASRTPAASRILTFSLPGGPVLTEVARIEWHLIGAGWQPGDQVRLEYTSDGGSTWKSIPSGTVSADAGLFLWHTGSLPNLFGYELRAVRTVGGSVVSEDAGKFAVSNSAGGHWDLYVAPHGQDLNSHGDAANPLRTIRFAMSIANGFPGAHVDIHVAAGTYQGLVTMKPRVNLLGGYHATTWERDFKANETILDGDGNGPVVTAEDESLIEGFTITGGRSVYGAGIYCSGVSPVIRYCRVVGNTASGSPSGFGGGIYANGGRPIIFSCVIANNEATWGDGIDLNSTDAIVRNCTVVDNGGIGIRRINGGSPSVANCILWNNGDDLYSMASSYSIIQDSDTGTGVIHDDPLLDANYRLTHDSPAYNAGANLETYQQWYDFEGGARINVGTVDIGAHELSKPEIVVEEPVDIDLTDEAATVDFSGVLVTSNGVKTFTVRNIGSEILTGLAITKDGAHSGDFTVDALGVNSLGPGEATMFNVTFAPASAGPREAAIHITSNDFDENTFDIDLAGTGLSPEIEVEQPASTGLTDGTSSIDFGSVNSGGSSVRTFTVRNAGTAPLTGLALTTDGPHAAHFSAGLLPTTTLNPGESTTFNITFNASGFGSRSAALHIASSDLDEDPFDVSLSATALDSEIVVEHPADTGLVDGVSGVEFGTVNLGASSQRVFTVRNVGNIPLTGLATSIDGAQSSDFVAGAFGATTLNAGQSTTIALTFMPQAVGARAAALHIASSDGDENPFDVALSGNGVTPEIVVEQPAGAGLVDGTAVTDFGSVTPEASSVRVYTIRNTGTGPLVGLAASIDGGQAGDFSTGAFGATTLQPSESTTLAVTFAPTAAGTRNAGLHITSNDLDESSFDISITGVGLDPEIVVEQPVATNLTDGASAITYSDVYLGASAQKTFTIRNVGTVPLTGLVASIDGSHADDFIGGALGATDLNPGEVTTIVVAFTPSNLGTRDAALHIASNDRDENPFDIALIGNGVTPEIEVEQPVGNGLVDGVSSIDFGDQLVGVGAVRAFTIRNTGSGPLTGLVTSVVGADAANYSAAAPGVTTLNPGEDTLFLVTFNPAAAGAREASLRIASNDTDENPFDIGLAGTGVAPEIAISLNGKDLTDGTAEAVFSDIIDPRGDETLVFTIRNDGQAPLSGISVSIDGANAAEFMSIPVGPNLAPSTSVNFTVTFTPAALGARTAVLHIASNDADENPFDIVLRGTKLEQTSLRSWGESFGLSGDELLPTADGDGDFVTLLEEYAYNLDPTIADAAYLIPGTGDSGLPVIRLVGTGDNQRLRTEYLRRRSDPNLIYIPEFGGELSGSAPEGFNPASEPESVSEVNVNFHRVIVDDSATVVTAPRRFGRVKLEYSPAP